MYDLTDPREVAILVRNAEGKIKSNVRTILELETENLRSYLERDNPNIEGALRCVQILENLLDDLGGRII